MKHVIVFLQVLIMGSIAFFVSADEINTDPEKAISNLEEILKPWEVETPDPEQGVKVLKQTIPFAFIFRTDLSQNPDLEKRCRTLRKKVSDLLYRLRKTFRVSPDLRYKELDIYYAAVFGLVYKLRGYPKWERMKEEFSDPYGTPVFKKYVRGTELERALLHCCLENLNTTALLTLSASSNCIKTGETVTCTYAIEKAPEGVWLSRSTSAPEFTFTRVESPVVLYKDGRRRAVGRGGGSAAASCNPFYNYRFYRSGKKVSIGNITYSSKYPGILRVTWKGTESNTQLVWKDMLPSGEKEEWKLKAGTAEGCSGFTIPVLPSPSRREQSSNGLYLKIFSNPKKTVKTESAYPRIKVELGLTQKFRTRVLDITETKNSGFWMIVFSKEMSYIMAKRRSFGEGFNVSKENVIVYLDPFLQKSISTCIDIPYQLNPGTYYIVVGLGPVSHDPKFPLGDTYWQGEVISELTKIVIR